MAQLIPPSDEERELYYYGLPSRPRLVARSSSSSDPWVNPQMPGPTTWRGSTSNMYPRLLRPAKGDPALHQQWNNAASSLRIQIMEAVNAVDWTAIDILSVGLEKPEEPEPEAQYHNTLLVAVKPKSLPWSRGNTLALRCKAILEEHGFKDMHCEIRESDVILLTGAPSAQSPPSATPSPDDESGTLPSELQLSSGLISVNDNVTCRANLSDCLGTTITTMDRSYLRGTKGYYVFVDREPDQGGPTIAMITCRHVAMDSKTEADGLVEYRHEPSQPRREVVQMDQTTYKALLEDVDNNVEIFEEQARQERLNNATDLVTVNEILAGRSSALSRTMKRYAAPSSRVFGHLLYASEFQLSTSSDSAQWPRDWALFELHPSRHKTSLNSLSNTVFVGVPKTTFRAHMNRCKKGWEGIPASTPKIDGCTFRLKKEVVPVSELFRPPHEIVRKEQNAILVAKYGATTGLTIGLGSTLRSVTRRTDILAPLSQTPSSEAPFKERVVISEEWCIVSAASANDRWATFSDRGDSGSCIWDLDGRVAGLLTAGACNQETSGVDTTYAQPMERLIEDIRAQGFNVSLM
ncbi:hypothetical protein ACHAPX_009998 [Trichoderma viride]